MIFAENLLKFFKSKNIDFFTGVPDSVLKFFTLPLEQKKKSQHIISTNEGSAVATAIGYYLSKKKIGAVYLQNSGLGNAINPLISIASKEVYSIPMILIIGWRGAPGQQDEPQHKAKGKITLKLLKLLNIKSCVLKNEKDFMKLSNLIAHAKKNKVPVACLIKKNIIISKKKNLSILNKKNNNKILRSFVLSEILDKIKKNTKIISTTGFTSRELFQIRKSKKIFNSSDFYMVGGMGHSLAVTLGVAINSKKNILCLDGDGSILMHMGSMGLVGKFGPKNLKHIILNNNSHESVGGQSTIANNINFSKLSKSFGYKNFYLANDNKSFKKNLTKFITSKGPSLFEIKIINRALKNLTRPDNLNIIKRRFMKNA
jgi:phosphonopyruvate decarboxylase